VSGDVVQPGSLLSDRYKIEQKLGVGALTTAYLASDTLLERNVVVKVLLKKHSTNKKLCDQFKKEARFAANIIHKNIVSVYDFGLYEGTSFIVLEYLERKSLTQILKEKKRLSGARATHIASEVASGLEYAHTKGVYHRDLNPRNILITDSGEVKISDFGIGRIQQNDTSNDSNLYYLEKYLAPEQVKGNKGNAGSDIYSLGVVLFEMILGKVPSRSMTGAVANSGYISITEQPKIEDLDVDDWLSEIVSKLLSPDPTDRYSSAGDVYKALKGDDVAGNKSLEALKLPDIEIKKTETEAHNMRKDIASLVMIVPEPRPEPNTVKGNLNIDSLINQPMVKVGAVALTGFFVAVIIFALLFGL